MLIELRVEFLCYLLSCEQSVLQYDPQGEGQEKLREEETCQMTTHL